MDTNAVVAATGCGNSRIVYSVHDTCRMRCRNRRRNCRQRLLEQRVWRRINFQWPTMSQSDAACVRVHETDFSPVPASGRNTSRSVPTRPAGREHREPASPVMPTRLGWFPARSRRIRWYSAWWSRSRIRPGRSSLSPRAWTAARPRPGNFQSASNSPWLAPVPCTQCYFH